MDVNGLSQRNKFVRNALIAVSVSLATIFLLGFFMRGAELGKKIQHFSIFESLSYFLVFSIVFVIDSFRTVIISHFLGERFPFTKALENSLLGYFFAYVTPFSAGGQPFQIYHLAKSGMKSENASAVILTRWSNMLIFLSVSSLLFTYKYLKYIKTGISALDKLVWIIIAGSVFVSVMIVFSLLIPTVGKFVVSLLKRLKISALYRFFFHRNFEDEIEKFSNWLNKFYSSIRKIWIRRPLLVILDMSLGISDFAIIFYVLYKAIVFSSALSETPFRLTFIDLSAIYILLSFIVYYIPTPGAAGGVEGGFFAVLSRYGSKAAVMRGILMWRISTYYYTILLGLFILFVAYGRGDLFDGRAKL